jgi:hypothetical protein
VDRHAAVDVVVHERHLDEIAVVHAKLGPRNAPVERQSVNRAARGETNRGVLRPERKPLVRLSIRAA